MLCNGAQRQRREEGQRSEDVNNAHQADGEGGAVGPQSANGIVDELLAHQGTGNGQLDHDGQIAAEEHGQTGGDVPEVGVVRQTLEAGTVVGSGRGVLIQDLGQAMEAGVGDAGQTAFGRDRQGREGQDQEGVDNDAQR